MYIARSVVFTGKTMKTTKHTSKKRTYVHFNSYLYTAILIVIFILFFYKRFVYTRGRT